MSAIQNPDGTIVPFPGFDPELGGHLTSLTKELAEACNYNDNYVNEEFGMMGCAKGKKFGVKKLKSKKGRRKNVIFLFFPCIILFFKINFCFFFLFFFLFFFSDWSIGYAHPCKFPNINH